jgi:valyl-tRNA synthetase
LLSRHYPNDVLISGFDILFFWDARMIMQGLHFMKEVPWKTLYLHGLVRAADGSKMSKSKGNTVDPLGLIDQYGADALRFTLTAMESQGRDIKLDEKRVEGYRNFATKLWNAARFCQANGIGASASVAAPKAELAVNRWIIGEVVETLAKLNQAIADLRFDAMADTIYHFAWGTFCDQYLEEIKLNLQSGVNADEHRLVGGWVFDQILVMLHPFMPFITEELWHAMGKRADNLIHAKWPEPNAAVNEYAKRLMSWSIAANNAIWSSRSEQNVPPSAKLNAWAIADSLALEELVVKQRDSLKKRGRLENLYVHGRSQNNPPLPTGSTMSVGSGGVTLVISLDNAIDKDAERIRITNAITAITKERDALASRLNNPAFVEKAKPEAVEKARADHAEKSAEVERLQAALARLG